MIKRVSRELGRPCRLHRDCRRSPAYQLQVDPQLVPSWWGRTGDETLVSPSEGNERGETDGKESQRPIVVLKRGNGPPGPRGAKGVPRCGRGVGTTPRTSCLISVSPRNDPVV